MNDFEKILKSLSEELEKELKNYNLEAEQDRAIKTAAEESFKVLKGFMDAGFTRIEAFELMQIIITGNRGGRN